MLCGERRLELHQLSCSFRLCTSRVANYTNSPFYLRRGLSFHAVRGLLTVPTTIIFTRRLVRMVRLELTSCGDYPLVRLRLFVASFYVHRHIYQLIYIPIQPLLCSYCPKAITSFGAANRCFFTLYGLFPKPPSFSIIRRLYYYQYSRQDLLTV